MHADPFIHFPNELPLAYLHAELNMMLLSLDTPWPRDTSVHSKIVFAGRSPSTLLSAPSCAADDESGVGPQTVSGPTSHPMRAGLPLEKSSTATDVVIKIDTEELGKMPPLSTHDATACAPAAMAGLRSPAGYLGGLTQHPMISRLARHSQSHRHIHMHTRICSIWQWFII